MKQVLFVITLLTLSLPVKSQQLGTYELIKGLEYTGIQLTDSGFIKSSAHILNHDSFLSKGQYKINGDTLIINGIPWEGVESLFEIISQTDSIKPEFGTHRKMDSIFLNLSLEIMDEENQLIPNGIISLLTHESDIIATLLSDQEGHFNYWDGNGQVSKLRIGAFGYRSLELDLSKFRGYSTNLRILLDLYDNKDYNKTKFQEKYLINAQDSTLTFIGENSFEMTLKLKSDRNRR